MSQMNSHRPDPVPVVEGSAIGIIPNPMSGRGYSMDHLEGIGVPQH
jgi:hypothetical protein